MNQKSLNIFDENERIKSELIAYEKDQEKIGIPFDPIAKKRKLESILKQKQEEEIRSKKIMRMAETIGAKSQKQIEEILQSLVAEIRRAKLASFSWQEVVPMKRLPTGEDAPLIRMQRQIKTHRVVDTARAEGDFNLPRFVVEEGMDVQHFSVFKLQQLLKSGWEVVPSDQDLSLPILDQSNSFTVPTESLPEIFGEISDTIQKINSLVLETWAEDPNQKEVEEFKRSAK